MDDSRSHHLPGGGFRNPWLDGAAGGRFSAFLKWRLIDRLTKPLPRDPDPSVFRLAAPDFAAPRAAPSRLGVTWVGHSSLLLQIGGLNILTDPVWSERASPLQFAGPRRWVLPGVPFVSLPPVDAVLLSHNHYDHLDDATVRRLVARVPDAAWLVPLGLADFVRRRGVRRVTELDWWQEARMGEVTVACAPAQHFSSRTLRDRNRTLWCSWAVLAPSRRLYFGGDSGYHPDFATIGGRYGPFDVALLPIGAYEPRWFMQTMHMNPEEAVRAAGDVSASVMVPTHWGTFKLTDEAMDEPPRRARSAWQAAGRRAEDLWLLVHGETRWLEQEEGGSGKGEG